MITLVLGGVRSGKSEAAERIVERSRRTGGVTYLATGVVPDGDAEMAARVAAHRARRPSDWHTVEEPSAVAKLLGDLAGTVLVDSLGSWLAHDVAGADLDELVAAVRGREGDTVVVSEEVGLAVHAPSELGRRFADRLGELNRRVADVADRCVLVVAGRELELPLPDPTVTRDPPAPSARSASPSRRGWAGLAAAVGFLTSFGGARRPTPAALPWFPLVGAVLGLALGGLWWLARLVAPALLAAVLVVAADLVLTGGLHLDGLADTADGLLAPLERPRRLAAMADPGVGAFGSAAVTVTLLARTAALAAIPAARPLLLAAAWCGSRTTMALAASTLRYARPTGLASAFVGGRVMPVLVSAVALGAALTWLGGSRVGAALIVGGAAGVGVHALALRRIGGFTGDTLGAAGVVTETAALVTAALV